MKFDNKLFDIYFNFDIIKATEVAFIFNLEKL